MFPNFLDRHQTSTTKFSRKRKGVGSFYRLRRNKWLHDERFEASLEEDNIDESIVENEVAILQEEWQKKTKRKKLVKVLQSNPAQIAVSILVLIDVLLMVALLLIDVHVLKDKMEAKVLQLNHVMDFFRLQYPDKLANYTGDDVDKILALIQNDSHQPVDVNSHHKRSIDTSYAITQGFGFLRELKTSLGSDFQVPSIGEHMSPPSGGDANSMGDKNSASGDQKEFTVSETHVRHLRSSDRGPHSIDSLQGLVDDTGQSNSNGVRVARGAQETRDNPRATTAHNGTAGEGSAGDDEHGSDHLMEHLSHIFHISSIVILGIMLSEVLFKMVVMGKQFFDWKDGKLEIMDAIVVTVSFTLDLIFYKGIFATGISEATTLLLIFLIWRMIQVFNGVISTTKRRLEFRIRLQKKARRQAEEKLADKEEQNKLLQDELKSLRSLCRFHKVPEDDIANCKPIVSTRGRCNSTSLAVSSIMRMSVGFIRHLSRTDANTISQDSCTSTRPISPVSSPPSASSSIDEDDQTIKPANIICAGLRSPKAVHKMEPLQEDNLKDDESENSDYDSDISEQVESGKRPKPPFDSGFGSSMEGSEKPDDTVTETPRERDGAKLVTDEVPLTRSSSEKCRNSPRHDVTTLLTDPGLQLPNTPVNVDDKTLSRGKYLMSFSCANLPDQSDAHSDIPAQKFSISDGSNLHKNLILGKENLSRRSLRRQKSVDDNTAIACYPKTEHVADLVESAQKPDNMVGISVEELDGSGNIVMKTTL